MKNCFYLILIACLFCPALVRAQTNFRKSLLQADPVPPESTLALAEKAKEHEAFLNRATRDNDPEKQIFGYCYLFKDYVLLQNYPEAARYLLQAERLAKESGNFGWQGAVSHRKGTLCVYLKDYAQAIPAYEQAAMLCGQAQDSLCLAESLEQLSAMHGRAGDYAKANQYFNQAMPLLMQYGGDAQVCVALNNFGNLLLLQGRPAEAIPYLEQALAINERTGDQRRAALFLNNLADPYFQLHRFDEALEIYRRCILVNREQNWSENLVLNYLGISEVYEQKGDFRAALDFFHQYHELRDSLVGASTQEKIADLQVRYESQQKELELQESKMALSASQRTLERGVVFVCFMLLLIAFGLWRWRAQTRRALHEQKQNQHNLSELTRILLEKNARLTDLEAQLAEQTARKNLSLNSENFEENLYNRRVLTDTDWAAFKIYFEKAHPGFLMRLRAANLSISDAEERLFLFIKLNLTRKEAAAMLGISPESVKKTRHRLRQRLGLGEDTDLDRYVHTF